MENYTFTRTVNDLANERLTEQARGNRYEEILSYTVSNCAGKIIANITGALINGAIVSDANKREIADTFDDVDTATYELWCHEIKGKSDIKTIFYLLNTIFCLPEFIPDLNDILDDFRAEVEDRWGATIDVIYGSDCKQSEPDEQGLVSVDGDDYPGFQHADHDGFFLRRYF